MVSNTPKSWINYLQMISDLVILNGALALAFTVCRDWEYFLAFRDLYLLIFALLSLLSLLIFNFYGLYSTANKSWADIMAGAMASLVFISLAIIVLSYNIPYYVVPPRVLFVFALIFAPTLIAWRWLLLSFERKVTPARKVVIIAESGETEYLSNKLNGRDRLLGVVTENRLAKGGLPVLGTFEDTEDIIASRGPDELLISGSLAWETKTKAILLGVKYGCTVYLVPNLYEIMVSQSVLSQFEDTPVIQVSPGKTHGMEQLKRIFDCLVAVIGLVITLPFSLAAALAIKLTSPGPVFYTQKRVGRNNKVFQLYKFRTMINNAEARTGPVLSSEKDGRVTKVGRILRMTRIDEIPQLINVLKGDMSIVGPRPERPVFVEKYCKELPGYAYRHMINTGITGLAQVSGKYSTSPQDKLRYDLLYAKAATPLLDLNIMLKTIKVMFSRDKSL